MTMKCVLNNLNNRKQYIFNLKKEQKLVYRDFPCFAKLYVNLTTLLGQPLTLP